MSPSPRPDTVPAPSVHRTTEAVVASYIHSISERHRDDGGSAEEKQTAD